VADVGSDHGHLPFALLDPGRASFVVATERTPERASRIGRPPAGAAWADRFEVRSGDGLAPLRPEDALDAIVLCGLGGRSILRILSGPRLAELAPAVLIVQPASEVARVRLWFSTHGWVLTAERLDRVNGRRHVTVRAERGSDDDLYRDERLTRDDLLAAGPLLIRDGGEEVAAFWEEARERLLGAIRAGRADRGELRRAERILARLRASREAETATSPPA
jgi:tRNA (adenine22-N1)-methyltransferase